MTTENTNGRFVQIHALVSYPPSNLNRDDMGRPKTAVMGGKQRLRISSQSIKRAWRESEFFSDALSGHLGFRTKLLGEMIRKALVSGSSLLGVMDGNADSDNPPMKEEDAVKWANLIAKNFAKVSSDTELKTEQLVHVSHDEIVAIDKKLSEIAQKGVAPSKNESVSSDLCKPVTDVDIALFGRMIADSSKNSVEAAAQVAHPITIHPIVVEDDWFTAVDDLNSSEGISGSAHIGVSEFGAGVFYTYVCVNRELLIENLGGNTELASKALAALVECVAKVGPKGKQSTFASRVYASYMMVETGNQQPRSLAAAFMSPFKSENFIEEGIAKIKTECSNLEKAYGKCADKRCEMNVPAGSGSLSELIDLVM